MQSLGNLVVAGEGDERRRGLGVGTFVRDDTVTLGHLRCPVLSALLEHRIALALKVLLIFARQVREKRFALLLCGEQWLDLWTEHRSADLSLLGQGRLDVGIVGDHLIQTDVDEGVGDGARAKGLGGAVGSNCFFKRGKLIALTGVVTDK